MTLEDIDVPCLCALAPWRMREASVNCHHMRLVGIVLECHSRLGLGGRWRIDVKDVMSGMGKGGGNRGSGCRKIERDSAAVVQYKLWIYFPRNRDCRKDGEKARSRPTPAGGPRRVLSRMEHGKVRMQKELPRGLQNLQNLSAGHSTQKAEGAPQTP